MFAILAYAPFLVFLPVLLVLGLVFVVVPGGFIVVLGGLYYATMGVASLLGLVARRRWRARASRVRRTGPSENASPSSRSTSGRRGAIAPRPMAVRFTNDRAVGAAANALLSRRGLDDLELVAPLERGRVPDGQDEARVV